MALYRFEDAEPEIGEGCFVAESAAVIGRVVLGNECYVGPGAVIRADYGTIRIGEGTAIEDACVVHVRPGEETVCGRDVTIGHGAIVHNAVIGDFAVIGMGAVVTDYARVGEWSIIGEGAVVRTRQEIPAGKVAVGVPARVVGDVKEEQRKYWAAGKEFYRHLCRRSREALVRLG
jgi:carbonic anhydrase/acetyltransferase-like protein (isoleucine patch superfamily)